MRLSLFDYNLPKELIAQYPAPARDMSRMMVLNRNKETIVHRRFKDIVSYLQKEDTAVFNDSRVIPARLICKRETGGKAEIFLLKKIRDNIYEALVRPASKLFAGKKVICQDGRIVAEIVENREAGKLVKFANVVNIEKELKEIGRTPLPPYIKRDPQEMDKERYQTIYAKKDGSTASPTAGLHFTEEILQKLKEMDVKFAHLTLHISYGTFAPVKAELIERHKMHKEYFEIPKETQDLVKETKERSGRIIAVGTSTARVLETTANTLLPALPAPRRCRIPAHPVCRKGWTGLFIYPPYRFRIVDALLTNFHLPRSTLLMLVSAFAGREFVLRAYKEAIRERYRFYSYGDCMLII